MWKISKFFQIPLSDTRMQELDIFDLEFYELSIIADNPKALEQLKNRFYDDEFDSWLEEFEKEQQEKSLRDEKSGHSESLDMPDEETIEWSEKNRSSQEEIPADEDYEISESVKNDEWEEIS